MGYKRCISCGGYCWLPGSLGGYCPHCTAELTECGRPAPVVEIGAYLRQKGQREQAAEAAAERMRQI